MNDQYSYVFGDKERIMTIFAHPDDLEITCSGTVARLRADGKAVRTICMTAGECGIGRRARDQSTFREQRLNAQKQSAMALGLPPTEIFNLGMVDGTVDDSLATIERLVRHIREFRPDVVITHNPDGSVHTLTSEPFADYAWVNHRDHRKTAQAVFDAVYPYSRDHAFFPDQIAQGLTGHELNTILFADAFGHKNAVTIDVQEFLPQKRRAFEDHLATEAITLDELEGYMTEGQAANGWFEILGLWRGLH